MAQHIPAPVISRHYPGMQGQVLPVQSMSARCAGPDASSSHTPLHLLRDPQWRELSLPSLSISRLGRRDLLPARVFRAQGQPYSRSRRPRCKPLNYSVAPRREDQARYKRRALPCYRRTLARKYEVSSRNSAKSGLRVGKVRGNERRKRDSYGKASYIGQMTRNLAHFLSSKLFK